MKELKITLPYPVSMNVIWRQGRNGRLYLNPAVTRYRKAVWALTFNKPKFGNAMVSIDIKMFPPDKRRRDADNICKSILDSLQHAGVIDDDVQVQKLSVEKCEVRKGGEIELILNEI